MPPAPRADRISYGPTRAPDASVIEDITASLKGSVRSIVRHNPLTFAVSDGSARLFIDIPPVWAKNAPRDGLTWLGLHGQPSKGPLQLLEEKHQWRSMKNRAGSSACSI